MHDHYQCHQQQQQISAPPIMRPKSLLEIPVPPPMDDSQQIVSPNGLKLRETLYRLMMSQLALDGHQHVASSLATMMNAKPLCPPSNRLFHHRPKRKKNTLGTTGLFNLVTAGLRAEGALASDGEPINDSLLLGGRSTSGLNFEYQADARVESSDTSKYETCYVTAHKAPCRAAAFDHTGSVIATGAVDASIKILDVDRMIAKGELQATGVGGPGVENESVENHPVVRTLYDHADEITYLEFHPRAQILASASKDYTIKFFEYAKQASKKAVKTLQEVEYVQCFSFHPSGEYMIVGTSHPTLRLYHVETCDCWISPNPKDQHNEPIIRLIALVFLIASSHSRFQKNCKASRT
ncbi:hypothetical protein ACOME3_001437 [Neoechinorhynchus agilis]